MTRKDAPNHLSLYIGAILVFFATYFFSDWVFGYYVNGDQKYYIEFYKTLSIVPISNFIDVQFDYTGSREPLYGLMMWAASPYIEKITIISIANSVFMSTLFIFLVKNKASFLFIVLTATNFYILVMLTSAERLKFAYIFAVLAVVLPPMWRGAMVVASLLSHFSILIVFLALLLPQRFRNAIQSFRVGGLESLKGATALVATFGAFIVFFYLYQDPIMHKVSYYISYNLTDMVSATLLFLIAIFVTDDRKNMLITMSLPLAATFFLGGHRVNMFTVSIFLFIMLRERKTNHPAVLLIMAYLSFKSIDFMQDILNYGTGFVV